MTSRGLVAVAMRNVWCAAALLIASAGFAATAHAQAESVQAVLERNGLIGVFAWDCNRPAAKDNLYYVNRVIDAAHAQRDQMSGPADRDYAIILDKASAAGANDIAVSGTRDGRPVSGVWRLARADAGTKSLSIDEQGHTRLYKCESDGKTLNLTFDENVNREGSTIREFNLPRADAKLCQQSCIDEKQCTAWVYRAPAGRTDHQPHCWLRNAIAVIEQGKIENLTISGSVRP
jgi:PAN domain